MKRRDGSQVDEQLAAFCDAHHRQLVGLLTVITGDRRVAEELAQEALVRLCASWPRVREMHRPDAWVPRVALKLANSRFRRQQAEWRANRMHGIPEADGQDLATVLTVRDAVGALPPRQRTVIALRYFVGLDVAETASEMGCAPGTVKSLTSKAMQHLRRQVPRPEEAQR